METRCAWCLQEQGIRPTEGDSHGICQRHYDELMAEISHDVEKGGKDDDQ